MVMIITTITKCSIILKHKKYILSLYNNIIFSLYFNFYSFNNDHKLKIMMHTKVLLLPYLNYTTAKKIKFIIELQR